MKHVAGIVLAGGRSRRMGADKAALSFGPETLLQRIARIVGQATSPVVVVAAQNQSLPTLPPEVVVARDQNAGRGPLEGIAAGLRALQKSHPQCEVAFVTTCDAPLLQPPFIQAMIALLDDKHDAAIPIVDEIPQTLAGVYRIGTLAAIESMLGENRLAVHDLLRRIAVNFVPADRLRQVDHELLSLRNVNTPNDFQAALAAAGLAKDN